MQVRRYSIDIKDLDTGIVVMSTVAQWTPEERRVAVALTMRAAHKPENLPLGEAGPA